MRTSRSTKIQDRQDVLNVSMQPRHKKCDNIFQIRYKVSENCFNQSRMKKTSLDLAFKNAMGRHV